ncbi:serine/threonine protein kinase [Rhodococcus sp. 27YEA15]|uniref:hypothetical protein n=1 Tax=Rhodococcus sp. 27YEA15 TaxID=3156259 RepID=UPI003C7BE08C
MKTEEALALIEESVDLFGPRGADAEQRRAARRRYHRLVLSVHPDRVDPIHHRRAVAATARLSALYTEWSAGGTAIRYRGEVGEYSLGDLLARGSVATLYRGTSESNEPVVLKIPRDPRANGLIENERRALREIADSAVGGREWWLPYFPRLIDHITHADLGTGTRRQITVLGDLSVGFVTLADVAAAYPHGLDPRDYAWMHRRILRALAAAHSVGWVHTALTPENVLIHPDWHGVVLAGWSFATRPGESPSARISAAHYPPEAGGPVSPAWDVYMAHQVMLGLLGSRIPNRMRAFASGCMQDAPRMRPDASDLLAEFDDLLDLLYGERTFRPFDLPTRKEQ